MYTYRVYLYLLHFPAVRRPGVSPRTLFCSRVAKTERARKKQRTNRVACTFLFQRLQGDFADEVGIRTSIAIGTPDTMNPRNRSNTNLILRPTASKRASRSTALRRVLGLRVRRYVFSEPR